MGGSSLWLLPPSSHPLSSTLTSLINSTTSKFGSSHLFIPHITLTVDIEPSSYSSDPQPWLDALSLSDTSDVVVKFGALQSEDLFFKKLYMNVEKDGLRELAKLTRKTVEGYRDDDVREDWVEWEYRPHLSLLYHDCPKIEGEALKEVEKTAKDAGVNLQGEGEMGGWTGGRVVLVPTSEPIDKWAPIAERRL